MANYEQNIKFKFKLIASFYDCFDLLFYLDPQRNGRKALAAKIPNEPLRILEICTGTANSSIIIARANDQNKIIGIDLSPDMLAVAQRKIHKQGLKNLSVFPMDATRLDFADGEFDVAMVSYGLHELGFELMMKALKELQRVLKSGGKLYILDYGYEPENRRFKNLMFDFYLKIVEPKHVLQFLKHDWAEILGGLGFQNESIEGYFFSRLICAIKTGAA